MALDKPSFGDQLYFFIGLAHTTAKFKNVYCEIFLDPNLLMQLKHPVYWKKCWGGI